MAKESKRIAYFKQQGTCVLPENYKLGETKVIVKKQGEKVQKHKTQ